jgi:uncharacterized membrane protein YfcA
MGAEWTMLPVMAVIFLATLIRSAFGFGEALVAVPLLALLIAVEEAVPLATLVSITVAGIVVVQDWHKIHIRSAGWLVISTLFGIPLGLWLLAAVAETVVKAILAVVIIGFSLYCLGSHRQYQLKNGRLAWLFDFSAGVLGGAYAMNGPPLVIYGSLRHWSPEHFRATLQGYFLPASLLGMFGYWLVGLWVPAVTFFYLWSLPLPLAAILLGRAINQRLRGRSFHRCIHVGLLLIGTTAAMPRPVEKTTPSTSLRPLSRPGRTRAVPSRPWPRAASVRGCPLRYDECFRRNWSSGQEMGEAHVKRVQLFHANPLGRRTRHQVIRTER